MHDVFSNKLKVVIVGRWLWYNQNNTLQTTLLYKHNTLSVYLIPHHTHQSALFLYNSIVWSVLFLTYQTLKSIIMDMQPTHQGKNSQQALFVCSWDSFTGRHNVKKMRRPQSSGKAMVCSFLHKAVTQGCSRSMGPSSQHSGHWTLVTYC